MRSVLIYWLALFPAFGGLNDNVPSHCTCAENRKSDGWCAVCKKGYLVGREIKSARLFEAVDAHGHDVQAERFLCESCKKAHTTDGYCDACRIGFVKGKAYLSRLTYEIARARRIDVEELPCDQCKKLAAEYGWCEDCGCGFIGHAAIARRADYAIAEAAWKNLLASLGLLSKCETCAVANFTGGKCLKCKLSYKTGVPVPLPDRPP